MDKKIPSQCLEFPNLWCSFLDISSGRTKSREAFSEGPGPDSALQDLLARRRYTNWEV